MSACVPAAQYMPPAPPAHLLTPTQDYSRLPVCLLLGTSTPADVLISSLSVDVCSRLCLRPFHMPPQEQRLEAFFQGEGRAGPSYNRGQEPEAGAGQDSK